MRVLGMADNQVLLSEENLDQIALRMNHYVPTGVDLVNVIELIVVAVAVGFVLGYACASRIERARMQWRASIITRSTCTVGTQSKRDPRRTVGAQSPCTYKRDLVTPRFQVLPKLADGVFDVSFSD